MQQPPSYEDYSVLGLENNDNMCYINATIQALLECKGFCNDIIYMFLYNNASNKNLLDLDSLYKNIIDSCVKHNNYYNIDNIISIYNSNITKNIKTITMPDNILCPIFINVFYFLINCRYNYLKDRAIKIKTSEKYDANYMNKYSTIILLLQTILRLDSKVLISNNGDHLIGQLTATLNDKIKENDHSWCTDFLGNNAQYVRDMFNNDKSLKHKFDLENYEYKGENYFIAIITNELSDILDGCGVDITTKFVQLYIIHLKTFTYNMTNEKYIKICNILDNYFEDAENLKHTIPINIMKKLIIYGNEISVRSNFVVTNSHLIKLTDGIRKNLSLKPGNVQVERVETILNKGVVKLSNRENFPIMGYVKTPISFKKLKKDMDPTNNDLSLANNFKIINYGKGAISCNNSNMLSDLNIKHHADYKNNIKVLDEVCVRDKIPVYSAYVFDSVIVGSGGHFICNANGYYIDDKRTGSGKTFINKGCEIERTFYSYYTNVKKSENFNSYVEVLYKYYIKIITDLHNKTITYPDKVPHHFHEFFSTNFKINVNQVIYMRPIYLTLYNLIQHRNGTKIITELKGAIITTDINRIIDCIVTRSPLLMLE